MVSVKSTEIQKTFGKWLDKSHDGPVAITKYDRPAAFLVSVALFNDLVANYRKAMPVEALSDRELALILRSEVETDAPYDLDDLPEAVDRK